MGKKQRLPAAAASSPSKKKARGLEIPDVAEMGSLSTGGSAAPKQTFDDRILWPYCRT